MSPRDPITSRRVLVLLLNASQWGLHFITHFGKNIQTSGAWHRHSYKEEIEMATRHTVRYSMALVIRELQLETTVRYSSTPTRKAVIPNTTQHY